MNRKERRELFKQAYSVEELKKIITRETRLLEIDKNRLSDAKKCLYDFKVALREKEQELKHKS